MIVAALVAFLRLISVAPGHATEQSIYATSIAAAVSWRAASVRLRSLLRVPSIAPALVLPGFIATRVTVCRKVVALDMDGWKQQLCARHAMLAGWLC